MEPKSSVIITGASGLVGSRIIELLAHKYGFVAFDRSEAADYLNQLPLASHSAIDLLDTDSVRRVIEASPASYVIHLAAYTDVDGAEKERAEGNTGLCYRLNVNGTEAVAAACRQSGKFLVYVSTEFVFDGKSGPYAEDAKVAKDPEDISWYGWTKLLGEQAVQSSGAQSATVRITYPFRAGYLQKADFAQRILQLYKAGNLYPMFADQKTTPTWIDDLATSLDIILAGRLAGNFHVACTDLTTPYDFAVALLDQFHQAGQTVEKGSLVEFLKTPGRTPRPVNGGLLTTKIQQQGVSLSTCRQAIEELYRQETQAEAALTV